jgi:hypothetical protein
MLLDALHIGFHRFEGGVVVVTAGEVEQFAVVGQGRIHGFEHQHDVLEGLAFAPEILGALLVVPDGGVFGEAGDLDQAGLLRIEVKDTSGVLGRGGPGPRCAARWRLDVRLPWRRWVL